MRVWLAIATALACGCEEPAEREVGSMLVDLVPGVRSSSPSGFRRAGDRVFFDTQAFRIGTWRSDGTAAGTVQISDVPLFVVGAGGGDAWGIDVFGSGTYWIAEDGPAVRLGDGFGPIAVDGGRAAVMTPAGLTVFRSDGTSTVIDPVTADGWTFARAGDTIYGCRGFGGGAFVVDLATPAVHPIDGSEGCAMVGAVGDVGLAMTASSDLQRVTADGVRLLAQAACCTVMIGDGVAYIGASGGGVYATDGDSARLLDATTVISMIGVVDGKLIASLVSGPTVAIGPAGRETLVPISAYGGIHTSSGFWFWDSSGQRWTTDGTAAGTRPVAPVPGLSSFDVAMLHGRAFYAGFDGHGNEPWVADVSAADSAPLPDAGPVP